MLMEWVETLTPIFVAIIPTIITVVKTARDTRKATNNGIKELEKKLDVHIRKSDENDMKQRRVRILRFADEVSKGIFFSQEYWDDMIDDMNAYRKYCAAHRDEFINGKCEIAMKYLDREYEQALKNNLFQ